MLKRRCSTVLAQRSRDDATPSAALASVKVVTTVPISPPWLPRSVVRMCATMRCRAPTKIRTTSTPNRV